MDEVEIAWRFRRTPRFVRQVRALADRPAPSARLDTDERGLRPIERRVLFWRAQGLAATDLAPRFRRTPAFITQVERLANYKLGRRGEPTR